MEVSTQILSNITVHMKYARFLEQENRRELYKELVDRNKRCTSKNIPS